MAISENCDPIGSFEYTMAAQRMIAELRNPKIPPELKHKLDRMYSLIRSQIVVAGGCELSDEQIAKGTVGELLNTFARNGISFELKFTREFADKYLVS